MWWHYNGLRQGGFAVEEEGTDTRNTDLTDSLKISCQLIVGLMDTSMKMSWLFYVHAQSFPNTLGKDESPSASEASSCIESFRWRAWMGTVLKTQGICHHIKANVVRLKASDWVIKWTFWKNTDFLWFLWNYINKVWYFGLVSQGKDVNIYDTNEIMITASCLLHSWWYFQPSDPCKRLNDHLKQTCFRFFVLG